VFDPAGKTSHATLGFDQRALDEAPPRGESHHRSSSAASNTPCTNPRGESHHRSSFAASNTPCTNTPCTSSGHTGYAFAETTRYPASCRFSGVATGFSRVAVGFSTGCCSTTRCFPGVATGFPYITFAITAGCAAIIAGRTPHAGATEADSDRAACGRAVPVISRTGIRDSLKDPCLRGVWPG
jgi:hypothetical protein